MFADGSCEARSRNEEEAMSGTSATTRDTEIARNPHQPKGWRRNGIDFFVAPSPLRELKAVALATNVTVFMKRGTNQSYEYEQTV